MRRLGLVAAGRQQGERPTADQPHPVLRVAHVAARLQLEQLSGDAVRDPALAGHLPKVRETIADHELRVARRREEPGDRRRRVLSVRVDHQDGVRGLAEMVDPSTHR